MSTVFVVNASDKPLSDRYDGVDYSFDVGKTVEIPEIAATHIFGYLQEDRVSVLVRLGVCKNTTEIDMGLAFLDQFKITKERPVTALRPASATGQVPPRSAGEGKVLYGTVKNR